MPKARDYHLTEEELRVVETAMRRDKRPAVRQRCTAIRLLHLGHKPEEVAEMQAVSIPTVYSWIKRWRKGGVEELATKPRSGRPAKANEEYERLVAEVVEKFWLRFTCVIEYRDRTGRFPHGVDVSRGIYQNTVFPLLSNEPIKIELSKGRWLGADEPVPDPYYRPPLSFWRRIRRFLALPK